MAANLTLGPVLFNWQPERWRDFYFEIADEAPVTTVYLGEAVCSKRAPLFEPHLEAVVSRLQAAGKRIAFSTLAEVMSDVDRRLVKQVAGSEGFFIEANDVSALGFIGDEPYAVGPYINVYNEDALAFFASKGAVSICLSPELPRESLKVLAAAAKPLGVALEVQVYGRAPLALSARCYHARAHNRTKDSCQFVCDRDPDGMVLRSLDEEPVLTINGIQTLSYSCLNLVNEIDEMAAMGIERFRLSPHSQGMVAVAEVFRAVIEGRMAPDEAVAQLGAIGLKAPFANGFYHHRPGMNWYPAG